MRRRVELCGELGMDALVETRSEREIESALRAGARVVGVNNRDLRDFSVDFSTAARLRALVPGEVAFVAESGVTGPESIEALKAAGADAALVGEALRRAADRRGTLREFLRRGER